MIQPVQVFSVFGSYFVERQGDYCEPTTRLDEQDGYSAPIQNTNQVKKQRFSVIVGTKRLGDARPLPLAA